LPARDAGEQEINVAKPSALGDDFPAYSLE
jgi:hypothetical protein